MKKYNHESMEPAERDEFMEKFMDMIMKRGKGEGDLESRLTRLERVVAIAWDTTVAINCGALDCA